jgi:hypothetical protein
MTSGSLDFLVVLDVVVAQHVLEDDRHLGVDVIKLLPLSLTLRTNKLDCFSIKGLYTLV